MAHSFSIVGAGRVGTYVSVGLTRAGLRPVSVFSTDGRSARRVADCLQDEVATPDRVSVAAGDRSLDANGTFGDVIIVAVQDGMIGEVDQVLDGILPGNTNHVILHTSGSLSSNVFKSLIAGGFAVGSLHPLQTFDDRNAHQIDSGFFTNLPVAIEGDVRGAKVATELATLLGAKPFLISAADKPAYHTAAVLSSNFFAPIIGAVSAVLPEGIDPGVMRRLAARALQNAFDHADDASMRDIMTGPIPRGDVAILEQHLNLLRTDHAATLPLYIALSTATAKQALAEGLLNEDQFGQITELLGLYRDNSRNQKSP